MRPTVDFAACPASIGRMVGPPRILVLATGGTIAGEASARGATGYDSGARAGAALVAAVPGLDVVADLRVEQVASIGSQDMTDAVQIALARRLRDAFSRGEVDGAVVIHGTDTMEETAFLLDLLHDDAAPVVVTGAMRPATALSADGPANIRDAVTVAASRRARGRGVLIAMNGTLHAARFATKTDTTDVGTFRSPLAGPVGHVDAAHLRFTTPPRGPGDTLPLPTAPLPRVDIVTAHAGMDGALIEAAVAAGARGIVLAGVGGGNASRAALEALSGASAAGILAIRSTRSGSGLVNRNVEVDDDALGLVASLDLNPPKARVLAQLLIAAGITDPSDVQARFSNGLR